MKNRLRYIFLPGLLVILLGLATASQADTILVNNWADSGTGSLRNAIAASNSTSGIQTIAFAVSNSITVMTPLVITAPVVIEGGGTTVGSRGSDIFQLNAGSNGSLITNLAIINASSINASGIYIASSGNTISGCVIGSDWADSTGKKNYYGIYLKGNDNIIGGNNAASRNVISGNTHSTEFSSCGIYIYQSRGNQIKGNYIGTKRDGMSALPNKHGIYCMTYSAGGSNLVGGRYDLGEGNVISGNQTAGVLLGDNNIASGNIVGVSADQTLAIPNTYGLWASSDNNQIGLPEYGKGNIVLGNSSINIWVGGKNNQVQNNLVGLNLASQVAIGSTADGVAIWGGSYNLIGGSPGHTANTANVISGNKTGVYFASSPCLGNSICGNFIGTDVSGNNVIGNKTGVQFGYSSSTLIQGNYLGLRQTGCGNLVVGGDNGVVSDTPTAYANGINRTLICGFTNEAISLTNGANKSKTAPNILFANLSYVCGMAGANDYIEIYKAESKPGQRGGSLDYLGSATADGTGHWTWYASGLSVGEYLCAIATDRENNASVYSVNVTVSDGTPTATVTATVTPTPTISATSTHSPTITSTPSITPTCTISPTSTQSPTITPTPTITITSTTTPPVDLKGKFALAYPNPGRDVIRFFMQLDEAADVKILVYNVTGEKISELEEKLPVGMGQTLSWHCPQIAPGIYLVRILKNGQEVQKMKVAIVK